MSIRVMTHVWSSGRHKGSTLLLLLALADHAADDGYCWPNVTTLADKIRMNERSVRRMVDTLEGSGDLYVIRSHRNHRYVVCPGMTNEQLTAVLKAHGEPGIVDKLPDTEPEPTVDILSETPDKLSGHSGHGCPPNLHETSNNHQEEAVSKDDFSDIEWHTGKEGTADTGDVAAFVSTGDPAMDILAASDLKKRRGIPDWAVQGAEGVHPAFGVVRAFCAMTVQDVSSLTASEGKDWLKTYATMARTKNVTVAQLEEAHRILPGKEWGDWHLGHHKWGSPRASSYAEMVVLAARQLQDGALAPDNVIKVELW